MRHHRASIQEVSRLLSIATHERLEELESSSAFYDSDQN
jgi:hypothetical protein